MKIIYEVWRDKDNRYCGFQTRGLAELCLKEARDCGCKDAEIREVCVEEENDKKFRKLMKKAFSSDPEEAFQGSIELCRNSGIPEEKILKSKEEIDRFFLGE